MPNSHDAIIATHTNACGTISGCSSNRRAPLDDRAPGDRVQPKTPAEMAADPRGHATEWCGEFSWRTVVACVHRAVRQQCVEDDLCDDVAQETLLRLFRLVPDVAVIRDVSSYVDRVARNCLMSSLARDHRRSRRLRLLSPESLSTFGNTDPDCAQEHTDQPVMPTAESAAASLGQREIDVYSAWQQSGTVKGAARLLNLDPRQVKRSLTKIACRITLERV